MNDEFCNFSYSQSDDGRYVAVCAACCRQVKTRTTKAVASCRVNAKPISPKVLLQAAGLSEQRPVILDGPGTELKALLKDWLGIEAAPGCQCNAMAGRMNALGADWCESEAGLAEILGVMQAEHSKRWADGRTRLPWTDFGAKQLVRLACRRARAKANPST